MDCRQVQIYEVFLKYATFFKENLSKTIISSKKIQKNIAILTNGEDMNI